MFSPLVDYHSGGAAAALEPFAATGNAWEFTLANYVGAGVGAGQGPNGGIPARSDDSGELRDTVAKVLAELATVRSELAAFTNRGPLSASAAVTCEHMLRSPPGWDPSAQSIDVFGFPVTCGGHRLHPNRHSYVDFLGIYSVTMPESGVMKAYGAACADITHTTTRVDRGPVDSAFPLAPGGVRESILLEKELAPGIAIKSGSKKLRTPEQGRYGEYLDGLHQREWGYYLEAQGAGVTHGAFRRAQSKYVLVAIQFGRQLLDHLVSGSQKTCLNVENVFERYFTSV